MFFKRKPKPRLEHAICMAHDAMMIAYLYLRDRKHIPTEEELLLLERLAERLWEYHSTARYIVRKMQKRALAPRHRSS